MKNTAEQQVESRNFKFPEDPAIKEKLMRYHEVDNDRDLRAALYREWLRKRKNEGF